MTGERSQFEAWAADFIRADPANEWLRLSACMNAAFLGWQAARAAQPSEARAPAQPACERRGKG